LGFGFGRVPFSSLSLLGVFLGFGYCSSLCVPSFPFWIGAFSLIYEIVILFSSLVSDTRTTRRSCQLLIVFS
jgi:hypothetical protein